MDRFYDDSATGKSDKSVVNTSGLNPAEWEEAIHSTGNGNSGLSKSDLNIKSLDSKEWEPVQAQTSDYRLDAVNRTIAEEKKRLEDDRKYLLSDEAKSERCNEIGVEIDSLRKKQQEIAGRNMNKIFMQGDDRKQVKDITEKLKLLYNERNNLKAEIEAPTEKEKEAALRSYGIGSFNNNSDTAFKDFDFLKNYGHRGVKAYTAAVEDRMNLVQKQKLNYPTTESILSYSNLINGKQEPLDSHVNEKNIDFLWNKITSDPSYHKLNYSEKRKLIDKETSKFISTLDLSVPEGKNPIDKAKLKNNIMNNLLTKFVYDGEGNLSVEGTKLYLEDQLEQISNLRELHREALLDAGFTNISELSPLAMGEDNKKAFQELAAKYGGENVRQWYEDTTKEFASLTRTEKEINRLLETPEAKNGIRDIGKAVKTTEGRSLITLQVSDMLKTFKIGDIQDKLATGQPITFAEKKQLETYATLNYLNSLGNRGVAYQVTQGITNMLPYIATFALTDGVYSGVKKGVLEGLEKSTFANKGFQFLGKKVTTAKVAARVLGSAAQTAVLPQYYLKNIKDYALDNVQLVNDPTLNRLTAEVEPGTGMSQGKSIARGAWDAYSEIFTERLGSHIMYGLEKVGAKVAGKVGEEAVESIASRTGRQMLKNTALAGFMKTSGIKTTQELANRFRKAAGWDGMMEEYLEEFVNYYMAGAADPKSLKGPGSKQWWSDQLVTFLTVAGFSGLMKPIHVGIEKTIGKNVHFTYEDTAGKQNKIALPREMYNSISNVFDESKGYIGKAGEEKLDKILDDWGKKLTKPQMNFAVHLMTTLGEKKMSEIVSEQATKSTSDFLKKMNERANVVAPAADITTPEDKIFEKNAGALTKDERQEVKDENDRIRVQYPYLYENNLLVTDPNSGQFIEPDKKNIKTFLGIINRNISDLATFNSKGEVVNPTPDVMKLIEKRDILESYKEKLSENKDLFENISLPEKHDRLLAELTTGKELSGTMDRVTQRKFNVKLSDGRTMSGYFNTDLSKDELRQVSSAILENKKVSLKKTSWEEWNPGLDIIDETGVPYFDKIDVTVDGKVVGALQVTDFRANRSKSIENEHNKKVVSDEFSAAAKKLPRISPALTVDLEKEKSEDGKKKGRKEKISDEKVPAGEYRAANGLLYHDSDVKRFNKYMDEFLSEKNIAPERKYRYSELRNKIGTPNNDIIKLISRTIDKFLEKIGAQVMFTNEEIENGCAYYKIFDNTIIISIPKVSHSFARHIVSDRGGETYFNEKYYLQEVFLHESVHAFTAQKIKLYLGFDNRVADKYFSRFLNNEERQTISDINSLFESFKSTHPDLKAYGLTNLQEFVAESFSNPDFIKELAKTPVTEDKYKASNVFAAFVRKILELLGLVKDQPTMLESMVSLVNNLGENYTAYTSKNIAHEALLFDSVFNTPTADNAPASDGQSLMDQISPEEQKKIKEALLDAVKGISNIDSIEVADVIPTLKDVINNQDDMEQFEKDIYNAIIDSSAEKIVKYASGRILKNRGLSKKEPVLSLDDLTVVDIESIALSGAQKVDAILNGYSPLWRSIATATDSSRDQVERRFYQIAKTREFEKLTNETEYHEYLSSLRGKDFMTDKIIDALDKSSLATAVSLFNFYGNLKLVKQVGIMEGKNGLSTKLLNPPERLEDFITSFWDTVKRYNYKGYTGFSGMFRRIHDHINDRDKLFHSVRNSTAWFMEQTPEERTNLRRQQFENDLDLLEEITGISRDIWRTYFNKQTKETFAKASPTAKNETDYGTYDNLLSHDTYRGQYARFQSNLTFNLCLKTTFDTSSKQPLGQKGFEEAFIDFFTIGNEDKNVLSNIYKLSTIAAETDDIALRGIDIKGDRFSSFIQSNMLFTRADRIRELPLANQLVLFYRSLGKDAEITLVNGINDTRPESTKRGIDVANMSYADVWITQLHEFEQGEDSYKAWMGQFGDKPWLAFVDAPRYILPEKDSEEFKKFLADFPDFYDAAKWIRENFMMSHSFSLSSLPPSILSSDTAENDKDEYFAESFVYNFAKNMRDIVEVFHGDVKSYDNDLVAIVKRGGSANSPGYKLDTSIEGGLAPTYQFALVEDPLSLGLEAFDGVEFMTGKYAERMQKSMGTFFSKENVEGMERLSTVKALHTTIDDNTNQRGLTKGNMLNIDVFAEAFPKSKFSEIRDFMKKNSIDRLSFTSTTKIFENAPGKKSKKGAAIKMWDESGKLLKNPVIPDQAIITRNTSDTYVQQDLRHTTEPKMSKMSSQLLANMVILPNGKKITETITNMQRLAINELIEEIGDGTLNDAKLKWIKENINENSQPELLDLLDKGMTLYEPSFSGLLRKMLSSSVTRGALEININRVATIEVPDPEGLLQSRRPTKNGKHILLPEIAANINGARYADQSFVGKTHKDKDGNVVYDAVVHVLQNKKQYLDLFDLDGNLMDWEISERNGEIPGEVIVSTRTPADDLHSHTVARLKHNISGGNFTMLDKESQWRSGSDFDGDQRYNWCLHHGKNGIFLNNSTKEGLSNKLLMQIAIDYSNPKINDKIQEPINTKAYDEIVNELRQQQVKYDMYDPRAWERCRAENMTGVQMKGIMTDIVTIYSFLNTKDIRFKTSHNLFVNNGLSLLVDGIARDQKGLMKINLANLLNMSFDNASDPKIEIMGLNEVTAPMFVLAMFGNQRLNTSDNKAIFEHVRNVSKYFTSPMVREFVDIVRLSNGNLGKTYKSVMDTLKLSYDEKDVAEMMKFYTHSRELISLRQFYRLTQQCPQSVTELQIARQLYNKVRLNQFDFIDTKTLFDERGLPVSEFAITKDSLDMAEDYIFQDSFEYSDTGRQIYKAILNLLAGKDTKKKKQTFTKDELQSISYGMNALATLKAIGVKQSFNSIQKELIDHLADYREKYKNNEFLNAIAKIRRSGKYSLEITPDRRQSPINDVKLAEIRKGFNVIYHNDPELADKIVAYAIMKWGTSTSTWRGSYFNLISDDYRITLSKKMEIEMNSWDEGEPSIRDKYQIMQLILKYSRNEDMKALAVRQSDKFIDYKYDYNSLATDNSGLSYDTIEGFNGISNNEEFEKYAAENSFETIPLLEYIKSSTGSAKVKSWAKSVTEDFDKRANAAFRTKAASAEEVKDMMPGDAISETFASEDPALQEFIYSHLSKAYPNVSFFSNHDAFVDFVSKWGVRGFTVNPKAIGHAFRDAVYVDPNNAVQSTIFHEYSHIYWDALPQDHKIKEALRELYSAQFKYDDIDDLDEQIILDIGRTGIDMAKISLNGKFHDKFKQLLQHFWSVIKTFFGFAKRKDLLNDIAYRVWQNSGKIKTSTRYSDNVVRNMITFNSRRDNIRFQSDIHTFFIGDKPIPGTTRVISSMEGDQFISDVRAKTAATRFKNDYELLTREKLSPEELKNIATEEMSHWNDVAESGTIIHAIAESVFGDRVITDQEKSQFEDIDMFYDIYHGFDQLRDSILAAYPNATFYTEQTIVSKKYEIGGIADLIVDTGNGDLIVYDFKTTNYEYGNFDMSPSEEYRKAYSLFKPPFQMLPQSKFNIHTLQLNIYANMLEEQENPDFEGKNNVVSLRIVPVIREIQNGKIVSAKMASNHVAIPRNEKTKNLADRMMNMSFMLRQDFSKMYPEFRENLEKSGIATPLINDTITAYHFFIQSVPNLHDITRAHIENVRGREFGGLKNWLFNTGFTQDNLYGQNAFSFEELFYNYAVMHAKTRQEFFDMQDSYFKEQEVSAKYKHKPNKDAGKRHWHRLKDGETEYLVKEVGYGNTQVGDHIMMVYDIDRPGGKSKRDIFHYTVISVHPNSRSIHVRNEETKSEIFLYTPTKDTGALKVYQDLPSGIDDPGPDSYVPRYKYEKEVVKELHFDYDKLFGDRNSVELSEMQDQKRRKDLRLMFDVFNKLKTLADAEEFFDDPENVNNLIIRLGAIEDRIKAPMVQFLTEISVNHAFAKAISTENNFTGTPKQPLPMTLNLYYILTGNQNAVWKDWDTMTGIRSMLPQRMIENHYVPLTFLTSSFENYYRQYKEVSFELNRSFKKFVGKVDYELAIVQDNSGEMCWRMPGEFALMNDKVTSDFIDLLYEYYTKYDPIISLETENGVHRRIPISNVYMTRQESIERYGKRFGPVLYDRLKPQRYDGVRLQVIDHIKNGKPVYREDEKGNPVFATLGEIKEAFAVSNMDPMELREFLGPKWKHIMLRIPGSINVAGQSGILMYYIKKAQKIYRKGSDVNNLEIVKASNKKSIPIIGRSHTPYATNHYVEAEQKALDSILYRYYMKNMIAPLDYMIQMYRDSSDGADKHILSYIEDWGKYILYKEKPKEKFLQGETLNNWIDFANRMNSMNKIMFSIKTQGFNLAVGQALDMCREPDAYFRGVNRIFHDPINGSVKAWNIAKRFGLANIVDDTVFDQVDKEYRLAGMDINKIEGWGYRLMEAAEKMNQFPVMIGLMTDEEWNSYDSHGNVINEENKLTDYRASMIVHRIQDIHGDYSEISMAPFYVMNTGKAVMPFKKWIPAYIWSHIAPYHIDKNLVVRSGIIPTLKLTAKVVSYNLKSVQARQDKLAELLDEQKKKGEVSMQYFDNLNEYFGTLIKQSQAGKIKLKDMSENDRKNLGAAWRLSMLYALSIISVLSLTHGGDDPDDYKKFSVRNLLPLIKRFQGDALWMYSAKNWQQFFQNMIPSVTLLADISKFLGDTSKYMYSITAKKHVNGAVYEKEMLVADKGFPKFIIDATYVIPAGSFIRWADEKTRIRIWKNEKIDFEEFGISPEKLQELNIDPDVSKFDLKEAAFKYGKVYQMMRQAAEYDAYMNGNLSPETYFDLITGQSLLKQERNQMSDALNMMLIEQRFQEDEFKDSYEEMNRKARELRNALEYRKDRSSGTIKKNFDNAIDEIK